MPTPEMARRWCDRHRGVGADGVLAIMPGTEQRPRMKVLNADGSIAEMCGNGLRCVAKHLGDLDPAIASIDIETDAGLRRCTLQRSALGPVSEVAAEMGAPILDRPRLGMLGEGRCVRQPIEVGGVRLMGTAVSMGNPHLVLFDAPLERAAELGPLLERHPSFPQRTNVEFVSTQPDGLHAVVWERGVGLTQACGTGACAVAVAGVLEARVVAGHEVRVWLPGGALGVWVAPDFSAVRLRGEAVEVFRGELD
jgi:diaminopimelate epimerase